MKGKVTYDSKWLDEQMKKLLAFKVIERYKDVASQVSEYCISKGEKGFADSNINAYKSNGSVPPERFIKAFLAVYAAKLKELKNKEVPEKIVSKREYKGRHNELALKVEYLERENKLLREKDELQSELLESYRKGKK
jgi:hypothetical protein